MMIKKDGKIRSVKAVVKKNQEVAKGIFCLELVDCFLDWILPGQFVCLEPLAHNSVMPRPFSVYNYDPFSNWLAILYRVVGSNTELISQLKPGQKIKVTGPLGRGLDPEDHNFRYMWLVAGGIGIAGLEYFKSRYEDYGATLTLFYGAQTAQELVIDEYTWQDYNLVVLTTDDGSFFAKGLITDLFAPHVEEAKIIKATVITCGPQKMMQKVAELCLAHDVTCYVILERIMACGINSCKGCSIKTKSGIKRVCHDGPVFPAEEVIWDELS